ncbi:MAG: hypothetical protein OXI44_09590 [Bacteroidota bacterium]|nr:hypothetical protein [Bacteroidota bacterium]
MTDFRVLQSLMWRERSEVQGFAPAPYHYLVVEIVVVLDQLGVVVVARIIDSWRFSLYPTLKVLHTTGDIGSPVRIFESFR